MRKCHLLAVRKMNNRYVIMVPDKAKPKTRIRSAASIFQLDKKASDDN